MSSYCQTKSRELAVELRHSSIAHARGGRGGWYPGPCSGPFHLAEAHAGYPAYCTLIRIQYWPSRASQGLNFMFLGLEVRNDLQRKLAGLLFVTAGAAASFSSSLS